MMYDELPECIRQLVDVTAGTEVSFYPVREPDEHLGDFVRLEQVIAGGLLQPCPLRRPAFAPLGAGMGNGFGVFSRPPVFANIAKSNRFVGDGCPIDASLSLYRLEVLPCYAATLPVRDLMIDQVMLDRAMTIDVFTQVPHRIEMANLSLIDFPRHPIVDYSRTAASWRVYSAPGKPTICLPSLIHSGGIATHGSPPLSIVRDAYCPHKVFIRRSALARLRESGVIGPDYGVLGA